MRNRCTPKNKKTSPLTRWLLLVVIASILLTLSACGGDAEPVVDNTGNDDVSDDTGVPIPTFRPRPTPTPAPEESIEDWLVDLEWPESIFLGESDVIRLTMTPSETGLVIEASFADHETVTKEVPITRPGGYLLNAVAELQSATFEITPSGPQTRELVPGKSETWHWSIEPEKPGRHRLFLTIKMAWVPLETGLPDQREFGVISHAFEIQVGSYFGLSEAQAKLTVVIASTVLIGVLLVMIVRKIQSGTQAKVIRDQTRNPDVQLEPKPGVNLSPHEEALLQTIYNQYARVVIEKEFMSGYSGARTFMTTPVKPDQRADAYSIIKISGRESITREYNNYQAYVKNTLPPTTARIQETPVSLKQLDLAALRYTFIGAPGNLPQSLRQVLNEDPAPEWFSKIADSYGPNWWLQRVPYTFRLANEYDRKLPAHYVIRPSQAAAKTLDGRIPMVKYEFQIGDVIQLKHFSVTNINPTRERISLLADLDQGGIPVKVTYLSADKPAEFNGEIVATRHSVLKEAVEGLDLLGLPDPLAELPSLLNQIISGSKAIIHGDLNLENILIGPGGMVWLIDFAETREGHTLFDFAHLYAEVIAHILSAQFDSPQLYLNALTNGSLPLLSEIEESAGRFLFNLQKDREFKLSAAVSCLGALKYANLQRHAKQLLYLTAAHLIKTNL